MTRQSGILLHVTSLPGGEGIGDLGASAHEFVDWLALGGQTWWQVLPCGETGAGESPYQSISAFAGNPLLVSLAGLVADQLLEEDEVVGLAQTTDQVDFAAVRAHKMPLLALACERFAARAGIALQEEFARFLDDPAQFWLQDYARFSVLKETHSGIRWQDWPALLAYRDPQSIAEFDSRSHEAIRKIQLQQFFFHRQWRALREHALVRGVKLLGDCPIYVALDSADVWSAPHLFDLHDSGLPSAVAGVPPDYFSATGQLWGNPLYRWDRMAEDDFNWWRVRIRHCAAQYDLTRIDHFRGLEAFWSVPADAPDASSGQWCVGPGADLLNALAQEFPDLPLIAEDLGDLTPEVHELRERFGLPGMRVLQFGFDGGDDNPHAPEAIREDTLCYAGTHDNNTTAGWYHDLSDSDRQALEHRFDTQGVEASVRAVLDLALTGPARLAVLSVQDLLCLGSEARFNTPGTVNDTEQATSAVHNWGWRVLPHQLSEQLAHDLASQTAAADRLPSTNDNFTLTGQG